MSAVAFCMDLILASLLIAALLLGLRLEKRLKALRESQAGFAGAVQELDAAIVRAEQGLTELKSAAAEAQIAIGDRVQDGKGMTARLDKQVHAAAEAAERLEKAIERYAALPIRDFASRPPLAARPRDGGDARVLPLHQRASVSAAHEEPLTLRREALSRPPPAQEKGPGPGLRRDERSATGARSRAHVDDELFDIIEPALKAARGMAR